MSGTNLGSSSNLGPAVQTATNLQPVLGSFDNSGNLIQLYGPGTVPVGALINPMTAAGDLIDGGTAGAAQRVAIGSTGQVLTVVGGVPAWAAPSATANAAPPVNAQTGTAYTLVLTDAPQSSCYQGIVTMNNASANTLTIPANASVAFPVGTLISVIQLGAGQTTIAITTDTLNNPSSLTARARYSTLVLQKVATTTWVLAGDMT
jgi:hypothetical protein